MPVCSSVAFLSLVHRCSVRLPLLCSSVAGPLLVCSSRCCCPVAVLSLVYRWSTAGLSARVRGRSSISSVAGLSARVGVADASLMCRWSVSALSLFCRYSARVMVAVTGLSLVHRCHWSVAGSSLLCSGHSRWSWSLIVRHSCATALPVPLSAGLSLLSLTCLLEPWSLIRRLSAARLPLVHLIVHRYSSARCSVCLSVCWPVACLSAGPSLVCLLARRCSSVAARPLLAHCWSACLSITGCHCPVPVRGRWSVSSSVSSRLLVRLLVHRSSLVRRWSVAGLSLVHYWSVSSSVARHWSVCSGQGRCPVVGLLLVCHLPVVGHGRSCVCSFVARCSPVAPPACPSLACLLVRCFPVCCSFTSLSARAMVAGSSLVHLLPVAAPSTGVVTGPSLVCPLVRHSSI